MAGLPGPALRPPAAGGATGFSVADLVSFAGATGTGSGLASCVRSTRCSAQVRQVIAGGIVGTPEVTVNGTALPSDETLTADGLRNAVTTAG